MPGADRGARDHVPHPGVSSATSSCILSAISLRRFRFQDTAACGTEARAGGLMAFPLPNDLRVVNVSAIPHRFIVVEGPIGVGKTSLARRLAQSLGGQLVLEQADQNPFLERFYKNPRAAAFQTQLFFLFQRARQLEDVRQEDLFGAVRVADYLLEKDRLVCPRDAR
jgi:hypothetical protein